MYIEKNWKKEGKMKAVVTTKYGTPDVLEIKEMEKPTPKDNEVLIRNQASSLNTPDMTFRTGRAPTALFWSARQFFTLMLRIFMIGIRKPRQKIPGMGFAGEIVSIGKAVTGWNVGDHVYGYKEDGGAFAEYMTVPAKILANKPANLSFQEAGAVPGGASPAIATFRDVARPEKDQKVLIIGASGGIGTFAVQIAKLYGAEVTGVCGPTNVDMVKEIGADFVIDYSKEDFTKNGQTYDIIYDVVAKSTFSRCKNSLSKKGVYVANNPMNSKKQLLQLVTSKFTGKKLKIVLADESADALNLFREWIENGKIKPVIDKVYPLNQTANAHRHYETGHSKGRVVISID
ncbi:MAG: NAD(P)-dependent alcohol dehydrogenase [Candidatus Hodarchaeales archaeon]|jgi:NADPH:quinone reductase-like Zn-dependent oxidoreductase